MTKGMPLKLILLYLILIMPHPNYIKYSKQFVDYHEDTQTVYLWRAGLLEHHGEKMTICLDHEQVLGNVFEQHATCYSILKIHRRKTQG